VVGWVYSRVAACRTGVLLATVVVHNGVEVHLRRDAVLFLVPVRKRFVCLRKLATPCQGFRMRQRLGNFCEGESPCVHRDTHMYIQIRLHLLSCPRSLPVSLVCSHSRIPSRTAGSSMQSSWSSEARRSLLASRFPMINSTRSSFPF
jgi:hypothetical protein